MYADGEEDHYHQSDCRYGLDQPALPDPGAIATGDVDCKPFMAVVAMKKEAKIALLDAAIGEGRAIKSIEGIGTVIVSETESHYFFQKGPYIYIRKHSDGSWFRSRYGREAREPINMKF